MAFSTRAAAENAKGFLAPLASHPATPRHMARSQSAPRTTEILCEGLAVPRETASPASEARRAKAQAARRERRPWMADANVRRRGAVNPEPGKGQAHLETGPSHGANVRRRGMGDPDATFGPRTSCHTERSPNPAARHGNHCCGVVLAVSGSRGSNWNIMSMSSCSIAWQWNTNGPLKVRKRMRTRNSELGPSIVVSDRKLS